MSRESCIVHRAKERIVLLREDYIGMMKGDHCAAALLSLVEYWANGKLADNPNLGDRIPLGNRSAKDWFEGLLGLYSQKRIMERLDKSLVATDLLEVEVKSGKTPFYWANIDCIQAALDRFKASPQTNVRGKTKQPTPDKCLPTPDKCLGGSDKCLGIPQTNVYFSIYKKDLKEDLLESLSSSACEREKEEAIAVEVLEDPEVVVKPSSTPIDSFEPCQEKHIDPEDQKAPAPCDNKGQRHRLRYDPKRMQELQDKINLGELSYLPPNELKGLADFVMGDIVSLYRQSGVILWTDTQRSRDINQGFLEFLVKAESHYIKNAEHARALIKNYEEKPEDWDQLISKVEKWQQFLQNPGEAIGDAVNRMGSKQASDLDRELSQKAIAVAFQQQRQQQPVTPENMDAKTRERWEAYQNLLKIQEATKVSATPSRPA